MCERLKLGIDLGTTSVKVCLVTLQTNRFVQSYKQNHQAYTSVQGHPKSHLFREQDVVKITQSLSDCLQVLSNDFDLANVCSVHVTGQMHGVLLWKRSISGDAPGNIHGDVPHDKGLEEGVFDLSGVHLSNLITWEDQRCESGFLNKVNGIHHGQPVSTGYGCASVLWLQQEFGAEYFHQFASMGTIMDFVVCLLIGEEVVMMSPQNACSWGFFDATKNCWKRKQLVMQCLF